jgi:hypothetical protein
MKWLSPANITAFLVFSASAILNYFGSNPRILYLPAVALCIWIMYQTHNYVSYKEKRPSPTSLEATLSPALVVDRPSLVVSRLSLYNLGSGRIPVGTIFIENLGKADAIDVEQESALIIEQDKVTRDPPTLSRDAQPIKTMIPAERSIKLSVKAIPLLKAETVEAVKQQTAFIYFYGVVHYYGRQLPKEQILKFCGLYDPITGDFKQTPFHNTTK